MVGYRYSLSIRTWPQSRHRHRRRMMFSATSARSAISALKGAGVAAPRLRDGLVEAYQRMFADGQAPGIMGTGGRRRVWSW
jgi:hypothetical protein